MYEVFYGLKEKPFSMLPDPGFLFLSKKHRTALTLLEYGLLNHVGFCVITGEAGAGKTTILRALLDHISSDVTVGFISNTHQSFGGLLDWILSVFDLHKPNLSHVEMHQIFMEFLIEEYANKRSVLLIVDEAQNMKAEALEELRMLSNVNTEKDQLMQVVLAGQPALRNTLRMPELMQFAQRIAVDYHLDALNLEETCGYIQHRLITAGAQRDIFTPRACERIHSYSGGTPRLINLLCETVMVYGFADELDVIDIDLVDEMVQERMKDSVVPIKNRDVAKNGNIEPSELVIKDFPWIRPEGGTKGLKPGFNEASSAALKKTENLTTAVTPEKESAETISSTNTKITPDIAAGATAKPFAEKKVAAPAPPIQEKPATNKVPAKAFAEAHYRISATEKLIDDKVEAKTPYIKYAVTALVFALLLIGVAGYLFSGSSNNDTVLKEEAMQLQKAQELGVSRLMQLQQETDTLKKERDAAIEKIDEEKRAKEAAVRLAEERAMQKAIEVEQRFRAEEKARIAIAEEKVRKAKQAESEATLVAKQKAAIIEQENLRLQTRLNEEVRLQNQQEALRLESARQVLLLQSEEAVQAEKQVTVQPVIVEKVSHPLERSEGCSGPAARFKSTCR